MRFVYIYLIISRKSVAKFSSTLYFFFHSMPLYSFTLIQISFLIDKNTIVQCTRTHIFSQKQRYEQSFGFNVINGLKIKQIIKPNKCFASKFLFSIFLTLINFILKIADKSGERCNYVILDDNIMNLFLARAIQCNDYSKLFPSATFYR